MKRSPKLSTVADANNRAANMRIDDMIDAVRLYVPRSRSARCLHGVDGRMKWYMPGLAELGHADSQLPALDIHVAATQMERFRNPQAGGREEGEDLRSNRLRFRVALLF